MDISPEFFEKQIERLRQNKPQVFEALCKCYTETRTKLNLNLLPAIPLLSTHSRSPIPKSLSTSSGHTIVSGSLDDDGDVVLLPHFTRKRKEPSQDTSSSSSASRPVSGESSSASSMSLSVSEGSLASGSDAVPPEREEIAKRARVDEAPSATASIPAQSGASSKTTAPQHQRFL